MARVHKMPQFLHFFVFISIVLCCFTNSVESANRDLNEENWNIILKGEWMVEFYAPWCPACNALAPAWKELSSQLDRKGLETQTGAVDVTKAPGLSGRFVVTALPTIFHVINGEFRQYKGPRDVDSMISFVDQQRWKQTEPIPSWKAPDSIQMTFVSEFFKLSQALRLSPQELMVAKITGTPIRETIPFAVMKKVLKSCLSVHNMLMETYGLPTWGSYLIFAVATIFIGAILGLILVCIIDLLYPPRRSDKVHIPQSEVDRLAKGDHDAKEKSDDDQELLNEDIVDEVEAEANSDAERNSPSDTSDDDKKATGDTPVGSETESKPEVRKRRPRKAD